MSPELVEAGNPNNVDDTSPNGLGGNSGAVPFVYSIGKYEVTNAEYVEFLNAVDPNEDKWYKAAYHQPQVGGVAPAGADGEGPWVLYPETIPLQQ